MAVYWKCKHAASCAQPLCLMEDCIDFEGRMLLGGDWIKSSECLPAVQEQWFEDFDGGKYRYEISEWLLGVDDHGEINVVQYESGPLWRGWLTREHMSLRITHWMPLPELPKEVGHG